MSREEEKAIGFTQLGLYRIHWKDDEGNPSLAAIGMCEDGVLWVAPTNWTFPVRWDAVLGDGQTIIDWITTVERIDSLGEIKP